MWPLKNMDLNPKRIDKFSFMLNNSKDLCRPSKYLINQAE